jgi:hypothetical protein
MGVWSKAERLLVWAEHAQFIYWLLSLGLGAVVKALVTNHVASYWLLPLWLISSALFLTLFKWGLRKWGHERRAVPSIQQTAAQPPAVIPGIPTLSALLGQNPKVEWDARKFFALAYYSPITAEVENNIKVIAQQNSPNDKEAFYARFIGLGAVAYQHDVTWFTIYGSQLAALSHLNARSIASPVADLRQFYDKAVVDYPKTYENYSFDQWLNYMRDRMVLAIYPSQMCEVSFNGKDFLKYLAHNGFDIHGKAN